MLIIKITTPITNVSDIQYKFYVPKYEKEEQKIIKYREINSSQTIYINHDGLYTYDNPICKHCYSHKINKDGTNDKMLIAEDGTQHIIQVQRYVCKKCGKSFQVEFEGEYEPYCNFSNKTKSKTQKSDELEHISLRNSSKISKIYNNIHISHETIRKSRNTLNKLYYLNNNIELSGYYGYDAQWVKIKSKWQYRLVLMDLVCNVPVAEKLVPQETNEAVKNFINKNIPPHKRKTIVTDMKPGYNFIMSSLGFEHQYCVFHLSLSVSKSLKTYLKNYKKERIKRIKKENPHLKKSKIKILAKEEIELMKKQINEDRKFIREIFKQESYQDALDYIEKIKQSLNTFNEFIQEFLVNDFLPIYKSFIVFLKKEHWNKLTQTNNRTENYIGNTLPKAVKNKYKTAKGCFNHIYNRSTNWIKTNYSSLTN